ncbi:MAG: homocysteine S-methyltransferase family protein [Clostridia bacterium]|nr:homocysteine S-methyltransferase family protein [Clostridia bacterium]
MNFREFLKNNSVLLDGGMGTLLQKEGLTPGELPERWNISHPEVIQGIHRAYFEAGSNVVYSNTFGANSLKFSSEELREIVGAAINNAKAARETAKSKNPMFVALDIGPLGRLLSPLGDLDFEEAVGIFAETVRLGEKFGADLIAIETMNDSYETKAALLAAKENSTLPVIVTNAYGDDGKLMTGASPSAMAALLEGMGADAIGANCSLGPEGLSPVISRLLEVSSVPVILKPNAGLPSVVNGETRYNVTPEDFASECVSLFDKGVRVLGGCCGTTPEYISALAKKLADRNPLPAAQKNITVVSSYTHAVVFGKSPVLIGERINPTGKKRFKQALIENDIDYILTEGVREEEQGAHVLDVNVGLPDIDECKMLTRCVTELQAVTDLPLQIDTSDPSAMESALRLYNGKAMINSVNGKAESMAAVFPLVKKYGGVVVALTLDESGIPKTAEERVNIARKILKTAESYGINKKDIIFDTLAMTVSADSEAANVTLSALETIKRELGCHTSLGVSNISFGLPVRDAVNSTFFALALAKGLDAAIMNPYSADMMRVYYTYRVLSGLDENCSEYIEKAESLVIAEAPKPTAEKKTTEEYSSELSRAIIKGFKEKAADLTQELLKSIEPLEIVNEEIIPALNKVGEGYEKKTVYLPGLLMSAEAAGAAFEKIKSHMAISGEKGVKKQTIVVATVQGDIHDIGKNIVKLILENYGYNVIDLGKDVPPDTVAKAAADSGAPLVGLSALMTTTVPAMEATIKELRSKAPNAKIIVGGAVLTADYAAKIGADKYAKDAMDAVRYAEELGIRS